MPLDIVPKPVVEARARLLVQAVFFSYILYDQAKLVVMKPGETDWSGVPCPTALTDGKNIVINIDFFSPMPIEERVFVLCHEVYHVMAMHPTRMRRYMMEGLYGYAFMPTLFNICADAVINKCLVESKIGKRPADCVWIEKIGSYEVTGMETAEELYKLFIDQLPPATKGKLATLGNGDKGLGKITEGLTGSNPGGSLSNDVVQNSPDPEAGHINEAEMRAAVQTAQTQAKAQGTMPAGLKRFIKDFLEPQIPWSEILRTTLVTKAGREYSDWRRPKRRPLISPGIFIPRRKGLHCGPMGWAVDTSGSVSEKELRQYMGEGASILGDLRPERVYLMWCDAQVDGFVELMDPEELRTAGKIAARGGGGTSFIPPFQYLIDNDIHVDTFVYFTDMMGPFPDQDLVNRTGIRELIWCASTDVVAPLGTTVKVTY